jgi:copper resistance protein B
MWFKKNIMKNLKIISLLLMSSFVFASGMEDDPLITKIMGEVETRSLKEGEAPTILELEAWAGFDLDKLWLKVDVEKVAQEIEEQEVQLLYSKAIAPYWAFQIGWRKDFKPDDFQREWGVIALKGLSPYLFETDISLFFGRDKQTAIRLELEYEYMFTQKLVISPALTINAYSKDDIEVGISSGLADSEFGLRLRYEVTREFAPYIGFNWFKQYGKTADFTNTEKGTTQDLQIVAGLRFWF